MPLDKAAKIFNVEPNIQTILDALQKMEIEHTLDPTLYQNLTLMEGCKVEAGNNVTINPNVVIAGNVRLGNNVHIGPFTFLRGPLYIADNVRIGTHNEIARSIFLQGSKTSHQNVVLDSLIGENSKLSGDVHCSNTPLLTKQRKQGAIVGNNTVVGSWVNLMPKCVVNDDEIIIGPAVVYKDRVIRLWSNR